MPLSEVAPELLAVLVVAVLILVMRWVFKPSRAHRVTRPVDAANSGELGLLTVVATVPRADANARRAVLGDAGIRSSASRRADGRMDLLVFHGDADRARRLLDTAP